MLKKIIGSVVLIGTLLFTGCGKQPEKNADFGTPPSEKVYKQEIKKYFDSTLKDPYSAKYRYFKPLRSFVPGREGYWQGWAVVVHVNAKNSYGGYAGKKLYIVTFKGNKIHSVYDDLSVFDSRSVYLPRLADYPGTAIAAVKKYGL